MNLSISIRSELLKTKRTALWYFTLTIAIAVSTIFALTVSANDPSPKMNPWTAIYTEEFKSLNLLVLPIFTILVCTLLPQIEFRSNTWKQVLASPQKLTQIYFSKFLLVQILLFLFLVIFLTSAAVCTLISGIFSPSLQIFQYSVDWHLLLQCTGRTYFSILALSVIQFILGLTIKSFIVPIAVGFILWLLGNVLLFEMHSSLAHIFPYSFSAMTVFPKYNASFPGIEITSVGLSLLCLLGGYFLFAKRKINS
jgi:lantibiotic transport system permease protein